MAEAAGARSAGAAGPVVERVRHWSGPDHTRVVLDLSGPPVFEQAIADEPLRLVLTLPGARFAPAARGCAIGDGRVARVRLVPPAKTGEDAAQVVLDLAVRREVKVFTLGPGSGKPHRLVIDVLRAAAVPPPAAAKPSPSPAPAPSPVPAAAPSPVTPAPAPPAPAPRAAAPARARVVVVDPGHGGEDPGAKGAGGVWEKDVCLGLARALAAELNRRPGIRAHLTREGDTFLTLRRRTRIAAEKDADLFVSIHANSNQDRKARGTEVYFLSLRGASDAGAREVAMRENAADHVAGVPLESQDDIENIVMDLMRTAVLERSSELAGAVIGRLRADRNLAIRGVKQAGFDVLKTAGMPSVLIETAFISNPKEAKLLKSRDFHQRFAGLVAGGIVEFLSRTAEAEPPAATAGGRAAGGRPAGS
jgi:N-acetylmuramoyl-L-alanine amidase